MKPAVLIGTEDRILNSWARFAKKWSFLPLLGGGSTKYVLNYSRGSDVLYFLIKSYFNSLRGMMVFTSH